MKLPKQYSFIKPDPAYKNNLMMFGCMCGEGWKPILTELFNKIQDVIDAEPDQYKEFSLIEVKEKYGTLRVYCSYYTKEITRLIDEAESKSSLICEECGKPGVLYKVCGWYSTLCNNCLTKAQEVCK